MRKNNWKIILVELMIAGIIGLLFYSFKTKTTEEKIYLEVEALVSKDEEFQLFYKADSLPYNEKESVHVVVSKSGLFQKIQFTLPKDIVIKKFRFDPGSKYGNIKVRYIRLCSTGKEYNWFPQDILKDFKTNDMVDISIEDENLLMERHSKDPFILLQKDIQIIYKDIIDSLDYYCFTIPIIWSAGIFLLVFICLHTTNYGTVAFNWLAKPSYSLLLAFILIITLPVFNLLLPVIPEGTDHEKREKKAIPNFELSSIINYPEKFTDYFNDHFGFRNSLTKLNSYFKIRLLKSSPLPDKVILGKNDWLFLSESDDINSSADPLFTEEELNELITTQVTRARQLKSIGIDYYVLILPEKSQIYPEYLPDAFKVRNTNARIDQLMKRLSPYKELQIIDPRPLLMNAKKNRELYYSSDTHWNYYAGMLVYDTLIRKIKKNNPEITSRLFTDFEFLEKDTRDGDLGDLMNAPEIFEKKFLIPKLKKEAAAYDIKAGDLKYGQNYSYINKEKETGKKIFLYHDSFAIIFVSRMEEDFSEATFYWKQNYSEEDILKYHPDIIVHEVVSRNINRLKE